MWGVVPILLVDAGRVAPHTVSIHHRADLLEHVVQIQGVELGDVVALLPGDTDDLGLVAGVRIETDQLSVEEKICCVHGTLDLVLPGSLGRSFVGSGVDDALDINHCSLLSAPICFSSL